MSEGIEAVSEVKKFLDSKKCPTCGRGHADLVITSVPKSTLKVFKELANSDEFTCESNKKGHYGFLLKTLVDNYINRPIDGIDEVNAKLELLADQISSKPEVEEPKGKIIPLLNGNNLRIGG